MTQKLPPFLFMILVWSYFASSSYAQFSSGARFVDWSRAGLESTPNKKEFEAVYVSEFNFSTDTTKSNSEAMDSLLATYKNKKIHVFFDSGTYKFTRTIKLPSHIILQGNGAENTTLWFDLGGSGHAIEVVGHSSSTDTSSLKKKIFKNSGGMDVFRDFLFNEGDWIKLQLFDSNLVTSSWALGSVGQILRIKNIRNGTLYTESSARMAYDLDKQPFINKLTPKEHVGIECLSIYRNDPTAPSQSSNLFFNYAVNCWVHAIESNQTTFAHIEARNSSNLSIKNSYFHHGFSYDGGGRAYGVMLHLTTNECLVENNIFKRLRHSMIVQAGANGNVFALNYSTDPFWESFPSDAAGDVVLHGNYVFANLFEQNICQNIIIDNSHGPNGPNNTFYRNKAEKYGIFFSASNSPNQNFIGNEITNTTLPYSAVNYTLQGSGQLEYANNNKGVITPKGTENLVDTSLYYKEKPSFLKEEDWMSIGPPQTIGTGNNHAERRFTMGQYHFETCDTSTQVKNLPTVGTPSFKAYPVPFTNRLLIQSAVSFGSIEVYNGQGALMYRLNQLNTKTYELETDKWPTGFYLVVIKNKQSIQNLKCIKTL